MGMYMRRDLLVPMLWGIPIALAFGFLGAIATGVLSMMIAAVGVWFGGVVDAVIQRITEVNMILPVLPIAITIYYLYSESIWMILGVIIIRQQLAYHQKLPGATYYPITDPAAGDSGSQLCVLRSHPGLPECE